MTLLPTLESLEEPSREIADQVLLEFGWTKEEDVSQGHFGPMITWCAPGDKVAAWAGNRPNPLASIDDAVSFIPRDYGRVWDPRAQEYIPDPERIYTQFQIHGDGRSQVSIRTTGREVNSWGHTLPIAITIAALKARAALTTGESRE